MLPPLLQFIPMSVVSFALKLVCEQSCLKLEKSWVDKAVPIMRVRQRKAINGLFRLGNIRGFGSLNRKGIVGLLFSRDICMPSQEMVLIQ